VSFPGFVSDRRPIRAGRLFRSFSEKATIGVTGWRGCGRLISQIHATPGLLAVAELRGSPLLAGLQLSRADKKERDRVFVKMIRGWRGEDLADFSADHFVAWLGGGWEYFSLLSLFPPTTTGRGISAPTEALREPLSPPLDSHVLVTSPARAAVSTSFVPWTCSAVCRFCDAARSVRCDRLRALCSSPHPRFARDRDLRRARARAAEDLGVGRRRESMTEEG
jgi:hypothetical protein